MVGTPAFAQGFGGLSPPYGIGAYSAARIGVGFSAPAEGHVLTTGSSTSLAKRLRARSIAPRDPQNYFAGSICAGPAGSDFDGGTNTGGGCRTRVGGCTRGGACSNCTG
jgi:hypothetical protein